MEFNVDERNRTLTLTPENRADEYWLKTCALAGGLVLKILRTDETPVDDSSPWLVRSLTAAIPQTSLLVITNKDRPITFEEVVRRAHEAGAVTKGDDKGEGNDEDAYFVHFPNRPPQNFYKDGLRVALQMFHDPRSATE